MLTVMAHPYVPPPIETATDPIHSAADMCQRWRALMGPLGFSERLLWIGFVGPDWRMVKALSQVPLGPRPKRPLVASTMAALLEVLGGLKEGTTVALLLSRPGKGPISPADRQWSTLLTEVAAEFGVPLEPIFRANDESLVQVEPEYVGTGEAGRRRGRIGRTSPLFGGFPARHPIHSCPRPDGAGAGSGETGVDRGHRERPPGAEQDGPRGGQQHTA
jgi:hypothetical protein